MSESSFDRLSSEVFSGCENLSQIKFPDNLSRIEGNDIFLGCTSLAELSLPKYLQKIDGNNIFKGTAIKELTLPERKVEVWGQAFQGMEDFTLICTSNMVVLHGNNFGAEPLPAVVVIPDTADKEKHAAVFADHPEIEVMTESERNGVMKISVEGIGGEETTYVSLKTAVEAINADEGEGPYTITLLENIDISTFPEFSLPEKPCTITGKDLTLTHSGSELMMHADAAFHNIELEVPGASVYSNICANGYKITFEYGVKAGEHVNVYGGAPTGTAVSEADIEIRSGEPAIVCRDIEGDASILLKSKAASLTCMDIDGKSILTLDGFGTVYYPTKMPLLQDGVDETRLNNAATIQVEGDASKWGTIVLGLDQRPYTQGNLYVVGDTTVSEIKSNTRYEDKKIAILFDGGDASSRLTVQNAISGNMEIWFKPQVEAQRDRLITAGDGSDASITLRPTGSSGYQLVKEENSWSVKPEASEPGPIELTNENTTVTVSALTGIYGQPLSELSLDGQVIYLGTDEEVRGSWNWKQENSDAVLLDYPLTTLAAVFTPQKTEKYEGQLEISVLVQVSPADFSDSGRIQIAFDTMMSFTYTGNPIKPEPAAVIDTAFPEGDPRHMIAAGDYNISYEGEGKEAGTYAVILTGGNCYTGSQRFEYEITPVQPQPPEQTREQQTAVMTMTMMTALIIPQKKKTAPEDGFRIHGAGNM